MSHNIFIAGEQAGTYLAPGPVTEADILHMANKLARRRLAKGRVLDAPSKTFEALRTLLQECEHEIFAVVLLDNQHRILRFEQLFRGTIDAASVYPREVVKLALACNAAAAIFVHNHPSGDPEPSRADVAITQRLRDALSLVDIRTLDHVIVGLEGCVSLAERGQI
ncbi:DNA repair protein RadC [Zobellella denitrificans]|uniref:RadC family protein n=1 Tax=Zobellella denitrificans TaxID=347534 RepID=UPI000B8C4973|nr:DNA repair protein RadC [Zobellella denitrificans]OXS14485.1 DNA repair protein RadC [Zobellella denitrificans]